MLAALTPTWALFLGLLLMTLAAGLQAVLLGVRAGMEGFSTVLTGLIMSGYFIGFFGGSLLAPQMIKRVGHVRVFAAVASLCSVAALVHALQVDPLSWTAMRFVTGFSFATLYIVAESWINDRATNETRGQMLAIYMVVLMAGFGVGPFLVNLADPLGYPLFIFSSILVSLALVPILLSQSPAPLFEQPDKISLRALYKASPLGVVGVVAIGLSNASLMSMAAVYGEEIGLTIAQISYFVAAIAIGGVIVQYPVGRLSDRFDRRLVITVVTFAAGLFASVGGLITRTALGIGAHPAEAGVPLSQDLAGLVWLLLLIGLTGGLSLSMYSLVVSHTNDHLEPSQMVAASATLYLANGVGLTIGPLVVGVLMQSLGPEAFFLFLATAHCGLGVFALYRMTRRAALPLDEQGEFVPIVPVAATLAGEQMAEVAEESAQEEQDGAVQERAA